MTPERFSRIPGQNLMGEAKEINEAVDDKMSRSRSKRPGRADEYAAEIIKEEASKRLRIKDLPPDEQEWYVNLQDTGVYVLEDGFLEIRRWDKTGDNFEKPIIIQQKVDGINSAIRMQEHILGGHHSEGGEMGQLESIQDVIERCNDLLTKWGKASSREKKDLQDELTEVVLQLENCRNEFKAEVRDQMEEVSELKDSKGRENPGALAARTVSALHNLSMRLSELQLIRPSIAYRKESLVLEKRRMTAAVSRSADHLQGVLSHSVFHESPKNPESRINDNEVEILNLKIGQVLHLLQRVHILPYSEQSEQAQFVVQNLKKYFSSKRKLVENLDPVKREIEDAIKILRSNIEGLG